MVGLHQHGFCHINLGYKLEFNLRLYFPVHLFFSLFYIIRPKSQFRVALVGKSSGDKLRIILVLKVMVNSSEKEELAWELFQLGIVLCLCLGN